MAGAYNGEQRECRNSVSTWHWPVVRRFHLWYISQVGIDGAQVEFLNESMNVVWQNCDIVIFFWRLCLWCRGLFHSDFKHNLQRGVVWSKSDFANANQFQITDDIVPFFGTSSSSLAAMLFVDHYHSINLLFKVHSHHRNGLRTPFRWSLTRTVRGECWADLKPATQRCRSAECVLGLKPSPRTARVCHSPVVVRNGLGLSPWREKTIFWIKVDVNYTLELIDTSAADLIVAQQQWGKAVPSMLM